MNRGRRARIEGEMKRRRVSKKSEGGEGRERVRVHKRTLEGARKGEVLS